VAQTVRDLLAHFPDKEGFAAPKVAIDANSVAVVKSDFSWQTPFQRIISKEAVLTVSSLMSMNLLQNLRHHC